ncbi:lipoate-protein ligase A [Gracilibacillus boraciitolerans JCM 21714]|uniref:Lipoate-protein ligase A n=1 Tax=Gracilibacillus boraciitolerans JCM 21714 TaxID=1298598 RepID=W4VLK0_9BACI|nr:lipoate-protein ligase A [Gracilibacillus boraciitolerans JCM 21714]
MVRRLSGGGAVYHDEGNLNFSFITKDDGDSFHNFAKFTEPVVAALNKLGVPAELKGRNDLVVEGGAKFQVMHSSLPKDACLVTVH